MNTYTVIYEHLRSGQPRPYADSVCEFNIEFHADTAWTKVFTPTEELAKRYAKAYSPWKDEPDWYDDTLQTFEKVANNKWHVVVVSPYLD